jgi:hypothetical protein
MEKASDDLTSKKGRWVLLRTTCTGWVEDTDMERGKNDSAACPCMLAGSRGARNATRKRNGSACMERGGSVCDIEQVVQRAPYMYWQVV